MLFKVSQTCGWWNSAHCCMWLRQWWANMLLLLKTPRLTEEAAVPPDLWCTTAQAAAFIPGLMRLRAVWGVLVIVGVFCGGWGGRRAWQGPLIFRRLLSSAHRCGLFLQLQFFLILFSWWIAERNVSLLWAGRRWCIEDVSPSVAMRQAAFWLNDSLCIIWW